MILSDFLTHLKGVSGSGNLFSARCPAHDDRRASLSISAGDDGRILLNCHAGCTPDEITAALGLKLSDLFQKSTAVQDFRQNNRATITAEYVYTDLNGIPVAKKLRYPNKGFCWLKPDGLGGWTKGRNGQAPLFNQFQVRDVGAVYIVEGEKDVQTLSLYGKAAVSLPDGAKSKWLPDYAEFFKGRNVAIIQDNDKPGKDFAQTIAEKLDGTAKTVKVLDLSEIWAEIPEHGDITDYVISHAGTNLNELTELANSSDTWKRNADRYRTLSKVEASRTQWLWYPYIPLGKITLMTADPGTGKTFLSLYITATVSNGRPFFGQDELAVRTPQNVVYQTAEDGIADTIVPRLNCIKPPPNLDKIIVYDEEEKPLEFKNGINDIENIMKDLHPALIIFDPLQAYLGAEVDMHRANEVRPVLAAIGRLAEKYNCAVIFVMHHSKMSQNSALHRALGSIDIVGIARSMLILARNPDEPHQVVMCHEKSSLAAHGESVLFHIDPSNGGIVFDGFSELKADDILNRRNKTREKPSVKLDEAVEFLNELIGEKGWAKLSEVHALQEEYGISKDTMRRAKKELQLDTVSIGYSKSKKTYWVDSDVDKILFKAERMAENMTDENDIP